MNQLIRMLREAIDAKHEEALAALDTIAVYLEENHVQAQRTTQLTTAEKPAKRGRPGGTGLIRDRVLEIFRQDFVPVRKVVEITGLKTRQVRGVLTAPDLKDRFERREVAGLTHYKYVDAGDNGTE